MLVTQSDEQQNNNANLIKTNVQVKLTIFAFIAYMNYHIWSVNNKKSGMSMRYKGGRGK